MNTARYRLGVDVGGTHTDLVLLDTATGELAVEKVASTPKNPAVGVLEGIARFLAKGVPPSQIGFFAHGTTITTNALLEMRGATVGLFITKGYRAVQEVQNQARDGNLFPLESAIVIELPIDVGFALLRVFVADDTLLASASAALASADCSGSL